MTKDDRKQYLKQYYIQHREERKEYNKQWYAIHREERKEATKKWHAKHPECRKQWSTSSHASVYEITNLITSKKYIGSTTMNPKERWHRHIVCIKTHTHRPLYKDMLELGKDNFVMEIIFVCPKDEARIQEQMVIDCYSKDQLYNQKKAI